MENRDTLAARLKRARLARNMTQKDLAAAAGVGQSAVGNIESGTRNGAESLAMLALTLRVSYLWLRDGDGEMEMPTSWPFTAELLRAAEGASDTERRKAENAARAVLELDLLPREANEVYGT